jgi:hypothetical protein
MRRESASQHVTPPADEQELAWNQWIALRNKALQTGDLADGIASGQAFASFHLLFIETAGTSASLRRVSDLGGAA